MISQKAKPPVSGRDCKIVPSFRSAPSFQITSVNFKFKVASSSLLRSFTLNLKLKQGSYWIAAEEEEMWETKYYGIRERRSLSSLTAEISYFSAGPECE